MTAQEWHQYAGHRGRVVNTVTGQTGNLHEVFRGVATVFVKWDRISGVQLPRFEQWPIGDCRKEVA